MTEPSGRSPPFPVWVVLWLSFVAAALFVPAELIVRFVTGPIYAHDWDRLPAEQAAQFSNTMAVGTVPAVRLLGVVLAMLYLLVRAITWRARHAARGAT